MEDWVHNPNKKQLGLYSALWFIGVVLLALAVTNFFTESPFVRRNGSLLLLVTLPTVILIRMIRNYFIPNRK